MRCQSNETSTSAPELSLVCEAQYQHKTTHTNIYGGSYLQNLHIFINITISKLQTSLTPTMSMYKNECHQAYFPRMIANKERLPVADGFFSL